MGDIIRVKRGLKDDLPSLLAGEFGLTTDEERVYIGGGNGNIGLPFYVNENITADDFQTLIDGLSNGSIIDLKPGALYNFNHSIVFGDTKKAIKINGNGATINFTSFGDGFVLNTLNENYGYHIIENLTIDGGNVHYPVGGYSPVNTGAGIRMETSYYCVVRDCFINGFKYGIYLDVGIKNNFEGKTYIRFNQYGIYFKGNATNINNFKGISIRENRKIGIYFEGGGSPFATHNVFNSCLIESNIPYPYIVGGNAPNDSVGIYLANSYNNRFINCYSENHQYSIYLTDSGDGNTFDGCRFSPSADKTRLDAIIIDGGAINNTTFNSCYNVIDDNLSPTVESNDSNQLYNQFINCEGFNFIDGSIQAEFDIFNNRPTPTGNGTPNGQIQIPRYGSLNNPGEGVTRGKIQGIGTTTAVLNAQGYGELMLGTLITASTTITEITNLKKGQFFVLSNYQPTYEVTIQSSLDGITGLVLKDKIDAVLKNYSDQIVFWVNYLGKVVEVGRNFNYEMETTFNSVPHYLGEVLTIGTDIYIATSISYGGWTQLVSV